MLITANAAVLDGGDAVQSSWSRRGKRYIRRKGSGLLQD